MLRRLPDPVIFSCARFMDDLGLLRRRVPVAKKLIWWITRKLTSNDQLTYCRRMSKPEKFRKVTVALPEDVLVRALKVTHAGITRTIIEGLHELERRAQRSALRQLKGKIQFDLELKSTRS